MIIVRITFRARQGHIRSMVEAMKHATANVPERPRILTDLSGPMNTMIMESRHASLAAYEQWRAAFFQSGALQSGEDSMNTWLESGLTEFYTIEQE
jgi:hypothetical protein